MSNNQEVREWVLDGTSVTTGRGLRRLRDLKERIRGEQVSDAYLDEQFVQSRD